ncbi:MAG TPA: 6-phosphogluconolactonase [Gemmataceae bacterium]|nr:6-phosphogluconolactonase [Gemmataceae bacterium]
MSARIIRTFAAAEALSKVAAWEFVHCAGEAIAARGRFTVALSGGSTPKRLYHLLTNEPFRSQVDWGRVEIFWGDERCVPPDHEDSNYRMAREAMLAHLPIPAEHVHRIEAERSDRDAAARDYEAILARVFGVSAGAEPPALDLLLMGMGPDGHTASLFPHTQALDETSRWVVANHVPQLNTDRLTLTQPILNRGREVLFLVAGADKAERLAEVLAGPADPKRLPSQSIQPDGQLVWFVDAAAAARLPPSFARENVQG